MGRATRKVNDRGKCGMLAGVLIGCGRSLSLRQRSLCVQQYITATAIPPLRGSIVAPATGVVRQSEYGKRSFFIS